MKKQLLLLLTFIISTISINTVHSMEWIRNNPMEAGKLALTTTGFAAATYYSILAMAAYADSITSITHTYYCRVNMYSDKFKDYADVEVLKYNENGVLQNPNFDNTALFTLERGSSHLLKYGSSDYSSDYTINYTYNSIATITDEDGNNFQLGDGDVFTIPTPAQLKKQWRSGNRYLCSALLAGVCTFALLRSISKR